MTGPSQRAANPSLFGVDLSHHQTVNDWAGLAREVSYVIHKFTQGSGYLDPTVVARMRSLASLKVPTALYHYVDDSDGKKQADNLINNLVKAKLVGKWIWLDVETQDVKDFAKQMSALDVISDALDAHHIPNGLYTFRQHAINHPQMATLMKGKAMWYSRFSNTIADPDFPTNFPANWQMWQYWDKGSLKSVPGNVDLNVIAARLLKTWKAMFPEPS